MCVLIAGHRGVDRRELWVAANRDERRDRPWQPPALLHDAPPVYGGRDLVAGGTWLAVNLEATFVVGVTNARLGARPGERSRGQLVLELARQPAMVEAAALFAELDLGSYGPFNLLFADAQEIWLGSNTPRPAFVRVDEPIAVLGNADLKSRSPRLVRARDRAAPALAGEGVGPWAKLHELLGDHEEPDPLCRHGELYGTVCSTVLRLGPATACEYRFASGMPCEATLGRCTLPALPPLH
jgi:uncharacterized protein with NRDE domain